MHRLTKFMWTLRALALSPGFGKIQMPSYMGPPTFIFGSRRIFLGRRVRIFPGLRAETHRGGTIRVEDNVSIGQDFHITAMGEIVIGSGSLITGCVTVTDIDHDYKDITMPVLEQAYIHSQTTIGKNCYLGMGARLQAGTILGDGCIVGANAVVRGTFPAHSVIVGAPARVIKQFDSSTSTWQRVK